MNIASARSAWLPAIPDKGPQSFPDPVNRGMQTRLVRTARSLARSFARLEESKALGEALVFVLESDQLGVGRVERVGRYFVFLVRLGAVLRLGIIGLLLADEELLENVFFGLERGVERLAFLRAQDSNLMRARHADPHERSRAANHSVEARASWRERVDACGRTNYPGDQNKNNDALGLSTQIRPVEKNAMVGAIFERQ